MLEIPFTQFLKKGQSYSDLAEAYLTGAAFAGNIQTTSQTTFLKDLYRERFYTVTGERTGEIVRCKRHGAMARLFIRLQ